MKRRDWWLGIAAVVLAVLLHAALDALQADDLHINEDGPALTLGTPLTRIDLKAGR
jgi:hypothetical protein